MNARLVFAGAPKCLLLHTWQFILSDALLHVMVTLTCSKQGRSPMYNSYDASLVAICSCPSSISIDSPAVTPNVFGQA